MADLTTNRPGVGVLFNPSLAEFLNSHLGGLDYLSVIPDRAWLDHGLGAVPRFEDLPESCRLLHSTASRLPLVMHCIGLSICSADIFDLEYLDRLALWRKTFACAWASEHLSFSRLGSGHESNAAMALPSPYDRELLQLLIPRVHAAQDRLQCPFLLENNVYYFAYPDQEFTEAEFLNELTARTGCSLLLDLHNVHTNAVNHGFDPIAFLTSLDLSRVLEIHVAGGTAMMGFHTDSHTGPAPEAVWELLRFVVPRAPALRGVTFEFHESSWPLLRNEGVVTQLDLARAIVAAPGVC